MNLIVATDEKNGIAKNGNIPWNSPRDMQHFKETTWGGIVIMGGKTWNTLPKALRNRYNIVIRRQGYSFPAFDEKGERFYCHDINSACTHAKYIEKNTPYQGIWVIGGESIYHQFLKLNMIEKCFVTKIQGDYECDQFFNVEDYGFTEKSQFFLSDTMKVGIYEKI